jgi:pentatricopeptide repeat protein
MIILSDGRSNSGTDPLQAAEQFAVNREDPFPIFTVGVGNPQMGRDIEVSQILASDVAFANDVLTVSALVSSRGFDGVRVPVELLKDGNPVEFPRKIQKKPLLLLKAIIALGGRDVDEERLTDILWPEADGDQAYTALTTTLSRLRQLLGEKVLEVRAGRVSLNPRYCWLDVWAFEDLAHKAEDSWKEGHSGDGNVKVLPLMGKAVDLYRGPFLAEEGSEYFWAMPLRERLRNRFLVLIEKLGRSLEQEKQLGQAIVLYQKGLEVDNLAEELYRRLMACYGSLGEIVKAVQVYRQLKTALSSVLGVEPSPKTEALYRTLTSPAKRL